MDSGEVLVDKAQTPCAHCSPAPSSHTPATERKQQAVVVLLLWCCCCGAAACGAAAAVVLLWWCCRAHIQRNMRITT